MLDKLKVIVSDCETEIASVATVAEIADLRVKYLGKSGLMTTILRGLKDVAPQDKAMVGKAVNDSKVQIESMISAVEKRIRDAAKAEKLKAEYIDVTEPHVDAGRGGAHPLTLVKNQILDIFIGLGFEVTEGPEIETDYYNFQALNIPKDHPARDMQDTFYFSENLLLRTHTSPCQAHTMEAKQPPIRMVCPGKVYRSDDDATHSPMFQQIEGLVVDKNVSMRDLKGTLDIFAKTLFSSSTKTRFRPSYFPFTEPSVEVDVTCSACGGKGCRLCKGTGWIEILGAGIVNPKVLENCGIDSSVYSGFAFGFGIDRITMIKYNIPDMRILFENDVRFLKQFK